VGYSHTYLQIVREIDKKISFFTLPGKKSR